MFHVPESYRIKKGAGAYDSTEADGNNGLFILKGIRLRNPLRVIASDGAGWEHVSVSLNHRCPTWEEMCHVKRLFWDPEDLVVQYHPPDRDYVNCHPHTLHLWRPRQAAIPAPPPILVGPLKGLPDVHLDPAPGRGRERDAPPGAPEIGMNRTETLLAFVGWVLIRHPDKIRATDAYTWAELIDEFVAANALEPQRPDWTRRATIPPHEAAR